MSAYCQYASAMMRSPDDALAGQCLVFINTWGLAAHTYVGPLLSKIWFRLGGGGIVMLLVMMPRTAAPPTIATAARSLTIVGLIT